MWRHYTSLCQSSYAKMLEIMRILLCEIWWTYHERFEVIEGGSRSTHWSQQAKKKSPGWIALISGYLSGPSNLPTQVKGGKENKTSHTSFICKWLSGWPSPQLIQEIKGSGFYLVAKAASSYETANGSSWCLSFSEAEMKLFWWPSNAASCRSEVLRRLKAIMKTENWHPLKSYHLKTILFYECEDKPHPIFWGFDQWSYRLIDCLSRLEYGLTWGFCPNYFMKDINLFESFSLEMSWLLAAKVHQLKNFLICQHIYFGSCLAVEPSYPKQPLVRYKYPLTPPFKACARIT